MGLGELEFPRKIFGLTEDESAILIREIAKVRNADVLMRLSNKQLSKISKQLHYNPLAIKWFLNSVDTGKSPKEVLNNKTDLLNYCLSNVYEKLSTKAKLIARYLHEALRLSRPKIKKYDEAIDKINQAEEIVPNYFEIYRI